jgi:hypothetical protein
MFISSNESYSLIAGAVPVSATASATGGGYGGVLDSETEREDMSIVKKGRDCFRLEEGGTAQFFYEKEASIFPKKM